MFEFVHLTGSAGKDLQTRRLVRSQAMRDFRRRQRAQREAATQSLKTASPRVKHTTSRCRSRDRSLSIEPSGFGGRPQRKRSSSNNAYHSDAFPASSPKRHSENFFDSTSGSGGNHWKENVPPGSQHSYPGSWIPQSMEKSSSIQIAPSTWGAETDDPFKSPAQISQMFNFCKSYIHWLRPGVDPETAGHVLRQAWDTSQCPMLLAACCLASVGHLDAVQPNRPGGNYALYKGRLLREVSERMQSPVTATSDETIGTLGCLLSFEMSRGSGEALTHLQGLKSIVEMKGGMKSLSFDGISTMLETLDLLHAALFDAQPVFESTEPSDIISFRNQGLSDARIFAGLTPFLAAEQEIFHQESTPYSKALQQLPELLSSAAEVLNDAIANDTSPGSRTLNNEIIARFEDGMREFGRLGSEEHPEAKDAHFLVRACHFNLVIIYNLLVHRVPQRHRSNEKYTDGLFSAMRCIRDGTWQGIPYLKLWILLSGAVASNDPTKKSYFQAQLVRAIYQMGGNEFRRIKVFMLRYFEFKQMLERPARRATPPTQLVTPVTTDTSYLYAGWYNNGQSVSSRSGTTTIEGHSPMSYGEALPSTEVTPSNPPSLYDDTNIDPFLEYGDSDLHSFIEDPGAFQRPPEDMLATDRSFHQAIYNGDFWFMDRAS